MIKSLNFNLNNFFQKVTIKKQQIQILKNKILLPSTIKEKNYESLISYLFSKNILKKYRRAPYVAYIIEIFFSWTNTLLHVMDSSGKIKFFCSAGDLSFKGKRKKSRYVVFKSIKTVLSKKLTFLTQKPVALHLKNVRYMKRRIVKELKKKLFVKVVKNFTLYPYNGCRKRKARRKKNKKS